MEFQPRTKYGIIIMSNILFILFSSSKRSDLQNIKLILVKSANLVDWQLLEREDDKLGANKPDTCRHGT